MRIVSLLSSGTEILFALGLGPQVLAVSHECDWPLEMKSLPRATRSRIDSQQSSQAIDERVKTLVARGEPLYEIDEPLLRTLRPDLIVTQAQCDVCAIKLADVLRLRDQAPELAGTQVLPLNPTSLDDVLTDIARIAAATQTSATGAALLQSYRSRIDSVISRTSGLAVAERPRVLCIEWIEPLMPAGNWTPQLIEFAGGTSGLATPGAHSRYATWQEVASFDPQLILVAPCGFDLPRTLQEARVLPQVAGWPRLTAVKSGNVFAIDGNALLNRSGPRLVDSLEVLAQLIQPSLFSTQKHQEYWQRLAT
jgi:iron complex transport system substrate-binding protein